MRVRSCRVLVVLLTSVFCCAQDSAERKFAAPVSSVQAALKKLPGGTSGPLPILDGFVVPQSKGFGTYQRPFYQCTLRVVPAAGGSLVRVSTKITAWNNDPAHSGYVMLRSNGRIESDVLDRLQELLGSGPDAKMTTGVSPAESNNRVATNHNAAPTAEISAPTPQLPALPGTRIPIAPTGTQDAALEQEAKSLEELLRNQAHPANLVAIKQDQTPVLQEAQSDAKLLFLASAEDEFEILDQNPEWVHIRISGLSRGWIRRASTEMLDGSEPVARPVTSAVAQEVPSAQTSTASSAPFSVSGEEEGSFPGSWAALNGRRVKIISIRQATGTGRITSPQDKMRFAEALFKAESVEKSAGMVLIFDAEDGGVVAATRPVLDQWKAGTLTEEIFWRECYLDPPEILGSINSK